MGRHMNKAMPFSVLLGLVLFASSAQAETGITPDKVIVGHVAAHSGPAAALGSGMRTGLLAAFAEANAKGGVHGRQLVLVSKDDAYEPADSEAMTRRIIEDDKVFALLGPVGTPTSKAAQPVAQAANVPFIGPFTGAGFLRDPKLSNVVNLRASYDQETEAWIAYLSDLKNVERIAILYQDDAFGQAGLSGVKKAMDKRGKTLAVEASFPRNTVDIQPALAKIKASNPGAVVMVGPYGPCAAFIKAAKAAKVNAIFMNISFVGSEALVDELHGNAEGVIVSQVVPLPWDRNLPIVKDYQAALGGKAKPGFISLEGYLVGRLFIAALTKAGPDPTRDNVMEAVAGLRNHDMGGFKIDFGPGDNQGSDQVYLTQATADGAFVILNADR